MKALRIHAKWDSWSNAEIQNYLDKFGNSQSLKRRSSSRMKKIKYLRNVLAKREEVILLITANQ